MHEENPDTPIEAILDFWFGAMDEHGICIENRMGLWFRSTPETDALVKQRFETWLVRATTGVLASWAESPHGRMALILLADQFPRNIYRGKARAFAFDSLARHWCVEGIELGHDRLLPRHYRCFFYLPLEHSEALADLDACVTAYQGLLDEAPPVTHPRLQGFLDHARGHRQIIVRFGRYPHRNRILGRSNTPQEERFLREGAQTFGQGGGP